MERPGSDAGRFRIAAMASVVALNGLQVIHRRSGVIMLEAEGRHFRMDGGQPILQPLHHVGIVKFFVEAAECRGQRVRAPAGGADRVTPPHISSSIALARRCSAASACAARLVAPSSSGTRDASAGSVRQVNCRGKREVKRRMNGGNKGTP